MTIPSPSFSLADNRVMQALNQLVQTINAGLDAMVINDTQHGDRGGGTLHAVATPADAGFMSAADKTALDGFITGSVPASRQITANGGLVGGGDLSVDRSFGVGANVDGSIIVNADDIQVGVLATDVQHGNLGGGALHVDATVVTAGFMSAADKVKLNAFPASAVPTSRIVTAGAGLTGGGDLTTDRTINVVANADGSIVANADDIQVGVLATDAQHGVRGGGTQHAAAISGGAAGFLTGADKARIDAMTIPDDHTFRVSTTAGAGQYTSIRTAILAAIAAGASIANPYEIVISPGTYVEQPMTVIPGIIVTADQAQRMALVDVVADNPAADLFTCTGGYFGGIRAQGTDATHCLFRMATALSSTVLHGCAVRNCTAGIIISNGASVVLNTFSILLTGAGQGVGTAIQVTGAGSYLAMSNCYFVVPAAILPLYPGVNPLERCVSVNSGATAVVATSVLRIPFNVATSSAIFADGGSESAVIACEIEDCNNAIHIGPTGLNTIISIQGCHLHGNTLNVSIQAATGTVFAQFSADTRAYAGAAGARELGLVLYEDTASVQLFGNAKYTYPSTAEVDLADYFVDNSSTGVCDGGAVTDAGGLFVDVAEGDGWIVRGAPNDDTFWVEWLDTPNVAVAANSTNYVVYDSASDTVFSQLGAPSNLQILLATVVTAGAAIRFLHNTRTVLDTPSARLQTYLSLTRKIVWASGLTAAVGTGARKIAVQSGSYYVSLNSIAVNGSLGADATWSSFYGTNWATETAGVVNIDITQYDNLGALALMGGGEYRADTLYITSDNRLCLVYGTASHVLQVDAEAEDIAAPSSFTVETACSLALIIVQQGVGIVAVLDRRPRSAATAVSAGVTVHAALAGLLADDHPQYMLVTGGRPMTGDLDVGGNDVTNVGVVDGVTVSAHAARHDPGGLDALSTGMPVAVLVGAATDPGVGASYALNDHQHGITAGNPVNVGTVNAPGGSGDVARADHVHAHANQTVDTLHALVVAGVSHGFMSSADKTKLDGLPLTWVPTTRNLTAGAGLTGGGDLSADRTFNVVANADGSIVVNANDIQVGVITDAQHGNRAGGALHPAAVSAGASGFMTGADKFKLDGIAVGATATPITAAAPANVTKFPASAGIVLEAARADHKHDITTAAPSTTGTANTEGAATSLARSDHIHIAAPPVTLVESAVTTTTGSSIDVLMAGMTLMPAAGTYMVWFSGDLQHADNNQTITTTIYAAGVAQTASARTWRRGAGQGNVETSFSSVAKVVVNGAQTIEGQWRTPGGTATNDHRQLYIMRCT